MINKKKKLKNLYVNRNYFNVTIYLAASIMIFFLFIMAFQREIQKV